METDFERQARNTGFSTGLFGEFFYFLREHKKWWLIPVLVPLLIFGVGMVLAGTGAAPFIYALF